MRRVREILRLRFERGLSQRQISASTGVSKGALGEYLRRAALAGLTWEAARDLDDAEVEARLFATPARTSRRGGYRSICRGCTVSCGARA